MKSTLLTLFIAGCISTAAALLPLQEQDDQKTGDPKQDDPIVLPKQDEDSISRRDSMRAKLQFSKNILEGLTIKDFDLITEAGQNMLALTEGDAWVAVDSPTYGKLTDEFKTATRRLIAAGKSENLDATALRFYDLSTRCIDCHGHLRHIDF